MNDRLKNYTDLLRTAATKTGKVRDGIEQIVDTLVTTANGRGEPWGDDTLGAGFANGDNGYLKSRNNILDGADNMAGTFGNFSKGQTESADYLAAMDHGNGDGFK
ncbi:hypothetical protein [Nocardia acidivorans]|uniref:hypothetical protein n=1 Tax=Nocardia acidivorans TaxID=404580 RepID=UPI00082A1BFB|nr:hypothetical protein [Nocardia acidivorans]